MKYYVYTLARPDGTIFYVGKGCGNRVAHHEQEALRGHNCPKCELIRSIWRVGGKIQRAIVFETNDERAALDREEELIRQYGYTVLVNRLGAGPRRQRTDAAADLVDLADAAQLIDELLLHYGRANFDLLRRRVLYHDDG